MVSPKGKKKSPSVREQNCRPIAVKASTSLFHLIGSEEEEEEEGGKREGMNRDGGIEG